MKRRVAATWPMTIFTSIIFFISNNHIIKEISKTDSKNMDYSGQNILTVTVR